MRVSALEARVLGGPGIVGIAVRGKSESCISGRGYSDPLSPEVRAALAPSTLPYPRRPLVAFCEKRGFGVQRNITPCGATLLAR